MENWGEVHFEVSFQWKTVGEVSFELEMSSKDAEQESETDRLHILIDSVSGSPHRA